jgi:hypothetical protein
MTMCSPSQDYYISADNMATLDLYTRNTERYHVQHGCVIRCKKGLWSVWGPSYASIEGEAMHYFIQYLEDGEYND